MSSRLRCILLGAPGSGKGTIANRIVKDFRLKHLSSGDLLRKNIDNKTPIGLKAKEYVEKGALLPDDFITKIIVDEVHKINQYDWLLDGFPRTVSQAKSLSNIAMETVVNLNVPFEEITNRLKHRWIHSSSGRVYNLEYNPPKVAGKDDVTGEPLIQREDDKAETVLKRLKIYEEQTKPIIDYYRSKKLLVTFTGNTSDYLWPLVKKHLLKFRNTDEQSPDAETHTGQSFELEDYRTLRFLGGKRKLVNQRYAIDYIRADPVVVCDQRVVWSASGGPLGHPKVYINISKPEVHDCGYSGRKFVYKKYYNEKEHGKAITYEQYLEEMKQKEANAI